MPKHRKNKHGKPSKSDKKPEIEKSSGDKPQAQKPETRRQPRPKGNLPKSPQEIENILGKLGNLDDTDDIDDDVSAAVAAYLSGLDESEQAAVAAEVRRLLDALGDNFEIINQEDEDDFDVVSPGLQPRISVEQLLQKLIQERDDPEQIDLYALSDLTTKDAETVRQQWEMVDVARRRAVVADLVEMAQEDIDLELGRFLRIALRDSDAAVRQSAVTGLWEEVAPDLVGPLVQFLQSDPDESVRAAAATGLGGYILAGELDELDTALAMRAEEALLAVLNNDQDPIEVRRRALESIAYSGEAGVRQLIEDGYYHSDPTMRVSAVFAMGRSADVRWRGLVRAELQSPYAEMRAEAAIASGELGAKSAAEDVSALLQDVDERVRLAAIVALGRIGGPVAQDALEAMLLSDNALEVEAADAALEEMQFFDQMDAVSLFDDADEEEWEESEDDDEWYDELNDDLGEYEDDLDDDVDNDVADKLI